MSDTPRTDVEEAKKLGGWSFARTLERELAAVTRERDDAYANVEDADRELKALRAEVERLTECLKHANFQAEEFERKWYLRLDEVERLREAAQEFIRDYIDGDMGDIKSYVKTFRAALQEPTPCRLGCTTECQAREHGCASDCPALPWQPKQEPTP